MNKVIAAALAICISAPTWGQEQCGPHSDLTAWLSENYGESLQSVGVTAAGFLETWANTTSGSFTMLLTQGETSCMVIAGQGFARVDHDPAPEGERM